MKRIIILTALLTIMVMPALANDSTYLNFTAVNGPATVRLAAVGSPNSINLRYSTDSCATWNTYTIGNTINLASGATVFFKALSTNNLFNDGPSDYYNFQMTGSVAADGNIMSLLDATMTSTSVPEKAFFNLFYDCSSLITAPALPATNLNDYCYAYMFKRCTSLTQAPALPATTLADYCYTIMFDSCTSLTQAPELPAMTLTSQCYSGMFQHCRHLTQAPALPATTLAEWCYLDMFNTCRALTKAPALPATTLADYCYVEMFYGCISLTQIPALPATVLTTFCYMEMFSWCTSLVVNTQGPGTQWVIPATTVGLYSLEGMFSNTDGTMSGTPSANTIYYLPAGLSSYTVTARSNNADMGTVTGGGFYDNGDTVTLIAKAKPHHYFVNWSNGLTTDTLTFAVTKDTTLTANFAAEQHTVNVNCNDATMGSVSGGGVYGYGQTITLTATPAACHHLVSWSNGATTNPLRLTVSCDTTLTATFAIDQYTVAASSNDSAMGGVTGGGNYECGDTATLIATPKAHHHFVSWGNGNTASTITVPVYGDSTITATFAIDQYAVTVSSNDAAMGSVTGGGVYNYGQTVTLSATAKPHHHLVSWSNGKTTPSITVPVYGDSVLTATFAIDQHLVTANSNDTEMGIVTGGGTFNFGDTATLAATANSDHRFVNWSNGATDDTLTIVVSSDTSLTATFIYCRNYFFSSDTALCQGDTLHWHGKSLTESGVYYDSLTASCGSDSIYLLNLTVFPSYHIQSTQYICQGDTFVWHNKSLTVAGVYTDKYFTNYGCDSLFTLNLVVNPEYFFTDSQSIEYGSICTWHNKSLTAEGVYYDSLLTAVGCDSVYELTLTVIRHKVTANSNDTAMGSVSGGGEFYYGNTATLTATAKPHHHLVNWSNGDVNPTLTLTVSVDTTLTANFAIDQHTVTATANDATMGNVTGGGTFNYGGTATMTATANSHHHFVSWSNGKTATTITVPVYGDSVLTAIFAIDQYTVAVSSNDMTMGSVTGGGTLNYGDTATLTATAEPHHHLVNWSNGYTTDTVTLRVVGDTTLTANFAIDQHTVTATANDATMGNVTGGGTFNYGGTATLTATANSHHHFVSWSNGKTATTITVPVYGDSVLTAIFAIDQYTVAVSSNDMAMGSVTGGGTLNYGDTATLTATAEPHHHLVSWSNGDTTDTVTLRVVGDTALTANFAIDQHLVRAFANNSNMGSVTGGGTYIYGDTATLTATANPHHHFVSWSNGKTATTIAVPVCGDSNLIATFAADQFTVTAYSNDNTMGSVSGGGSFGYGQLVNLTATPNAHYHFVSWSDGSTTNAITLTVTEDTTLTATFAIDQHTVTVSSSDTAMGNVTGGGVFDYGNTATLIAVAKTHYHLENWSNGATTDTVALTVSGDSTLTANFAIDQFTVTAHSNDASMGYILGSGIYDYGETLQLIAIANAHYHFVSWSNGKTSATISLSVYGDSTLTATFAIDQHILTTHSNDTAMGTVVGGGAFDYGDTVTLTAVAKAHYHFVSWSNGKTTNSITIPLYGDSTLTATFAVDQHTVTVRSNDTVMGSVAGAGLFDYGDMATLTATANTHHHFVSWSNGATTPSVTFAVTCDTTFTATFAADVYNGVVGDSLYWSIDTISGELRFTGFGSTGDYSITNHAPWYYYGARVEYVTMPNSYSSIYIGDYAFDGFSNLFYVRFRADSLGSSVFNGCNKFSLCYNDRGDINITKANLHTMDGCQSTPVLICDSDQWYQDLWVDSLGLNFMVYPEYTYYTDAALGNNANVRLLPGPDGISVDAVKHNVNGLDFRIKDDWNVVWKDSLVSPLVSTFDIEGVKYIGKNAFKGCENLRNITVKPYHGYLDTIHADAFDAITPDIIDLYAETKFQPGNVIGYKARKNNLNQTIAYVPDSLADTGKSLLYEYANTPYWQDNFGAISNKNLTADQYVDTTSADVYFYYQESYDSVLVTQYHLVLYKIGGSDTADVYFSNDTSFTMQRIPRIILIIDSVTGTTTTVTISIDHAAFNQNIDEVNIHLEHLAPQSTYSLTLTPLDCEGNPLDSDSCNMTTIKFTSLTEVSDDNDNFYPTDQTDVYTLDGRYIGKYYLDLPPGVYLMRDKGRWHKFGKVR